MKKLLPMILAGTMVFGLAACGGSGSASGGDEPAGQPSSSGAEDLSSWKIGVMLSGSPTDGGYCQQGADGIRAIEEKYGCQISIIDSVTTADDARAEAENMADDGYKVIFGQGGQFAEYFSQVAPDYPDTWFITNGGAVTGDNQFPMCMSTEEGGYVCGVLAGLLTETHTMGTIVSGDYPSFTKPGVGFALGAKSVDESNVVKFSVLSAANSNEAYETIQSQIQSGADVIFPNADEGNSGAIKAVSENPSVHAFGVFGDYISGAPEQVAGNMMVDAPGAYVAAFESIVNGEAKGEIQYLGMKEGIISFQWNDQVKDTLPEDVVAQVEQTIEDIKAGNIDIPNEYDIGKTGITQYFN
ncbi:BMP family protein [Pseudoflavonifractor sp. MSJ-37]|uniref:BMP family lipoprotein n=1 Tax=Pseudoflavonifractor sp. MSJ-37 TaxID=2841531 RepID=UPI001C11CF8B|nr:BMP family protein [Pseudoflavonifractor sp. MSJ-37]MBU5435200.1 BMP family protein [Pseudoflavonifractor sp. MSJ-37]